MRLLNPVSIQRRSLRPRAMIDTVVLTVARHDVVDIRVDDETPRWDLHSRRSGFSKHVKQPSLRQKNDNVYRPKVRGITRGKAKFVQIEFSIPKLLYGNNVDEVDENQSETVISILSTRLVDLGLGISDKTLVNATVSSFDPSKNIILTSGYTSIQVMQELSKINLTTRMDFEKVGFRNGGHALQCYAISHSFVAYDKMKDLTKAPKRAIDKDPSPKQRSLFEQIDDNYASPEILRLEVRLSQRTKMKQVMKRLGFTDDPTFKDIFKKEVCQKIVQDYWNTLVADRNLFLFSMTSGPQNTLRDIKRVNRGIKQKQAIYLTGLALLCKDEAGIRGLRTKLQIKNRQWYKIADDLPKIRAPNAKYYHGWVKEIETQIKEFKPLAIIKRKHDEEKTKQAKKNPTRKKTAKRKSKRRAVKSRNRAVVRKAIQRPAIKKHKARPRKKAKARARAP